jgi:hypothetical protein
MALLDPRFIHESAECLARSVFIRPEEGQNPVSRVK